MTVMRPWCVQFTLTGIAVGLLTVPTAALSFAHAQTETSHPSTPATEQAKKPPAIPLKSAPTAIDQSVKLPVPKKATKPSPKKNRRKSSARKRRAKRKVYPTNRPKGIDLNLPTMTKPPFQEGERLHFNVKMFNQLAGETILAVGQTEGTGAQQRLPIAGFLRGSPFLNKFYPIDNSLHVWLDSELRPVRSKFSVNENHKVMTYETTINQKRKRIRSVRTKAKRKLVRRHRPIATVYEPLGCIYAIRSMKIKPGDAFNYYLFDGRKERLVRVKVVGEESVTVPAGIFRAHRIEIETQITGGFVTQKMLELPVRKGTIWIGVDEHRTPLKMLAQTKLGPAEATLTKRYFDSAEDWNQTNGL